MFFSPFCGLSFDILDGAKYKNLLGLTKPNFFFYFAHNFDAISNKTVPNIISQNL